MYRGRICETGTPGDLLAAPRHPYTRMLLAAVADDADAEMDRPIGGGQAPPTAGCVFAARCPNCVPIVCATTAPSLRPVSESHEVACHLDIRNAAGPVVALRQSAGF
jgi:peptide/nickel transport system ATP-binding protein